MCSLLKKEKGITSNDQILQGLHNPSTYFEPLAAKVCSIDGGREKLIHLVLHDLCLFMFRNGIMCANIYLWKKVTGLSSILTMPLKSKSSKLFCINSWKIKNETDQSPGTIEQVFCVLLLYAHTHEYNEIIAIQGLRGIFVVVNLTE